MTKKKIDPRDNEDRINLPKNYGEKINKIGEALNEALIEEDPIKIKEKKNKEERAVDTLFD